MYLLTKTNLFSHLIDRLLHLTSLLLLPLSITLLRLLIQQPLPKVFVHRILLHRGILQLRPGALPRLNILHFGRVVSATLLLRLLATGKLR